MTSRLAFISSVSLVKEFFKLILDFKNEYLLIYLIKMTNKIVFSIVSVRN